MFDNAAAMHAIQFIELLKHADGNWYGKPFQLLPWQHETISEFYGRKQENGKRQYSFLYLEIPKKNGKSELAAGLGLLHTFADGEMRGEVYVCAADKDNASIVFEVALSMIEQCPALAKRAKITKSKRELVDTVTGTKFKVMSSEAYSKHGYKPSCVIFDELHAQPNRDLWDVMTFGAGAARDQPVWIVLTTAGDDPDRHSIGWEQHEYARKVRDGEIADDTWLPIIYGAPEEADIFDEQTWFDANPSLGHTIPVETVQKEALRARNSEAAERLFRWLRLNQWISLKRTGWLPLTLFDNTSADVLKPNAARWTRADLIGSYCYAGLDLASTTDLSALVLAFPPQGGFSDWRILFEAWIPEEAMREREKRDHVPFSEWVAKKHIHTTEGDATDYEYIEARTLMLSKEFKIKLLGTDQWNSRMLTQRLHARGIEIIEIRQNVAGMSPAMKEIEHKLRTGNMSHEVNPVARWCFGNTHVHVDGNENLKPMKDKSTGRIDITVAWINAMAAALVSGVQPDYNAIIQGEGWGL